MMYDKLSSNFRIILQFIKGIVLFFLPLICASFFVNLLWGITAVHYFKVQPLSLRHTLGVTGCLYFISSLLTTNLSKTQ